MSAIVELKNIDKSFDNEGVKTQVLFGVDVTINAGEVTLLVGPSGCGKTTLISIIGGILNADRGEINVMGKKLHNMTSDEKTEFRRGGIGFIFQQHNLINTLTVAENVAVPLLVNKIKTDDAMKKAIEVLDTVGIANKAHNRPTQLSGGEQQRVAIARALVRDPDLIMCDEPTASLDGKTGLKVVELIRNTALSSEKAVIIVTHDNRIFDYGDRMIKMEDGRIKSIDKIKREINR